MTPKQVLERAVQELGGAPEVVLGTPLSSAELAELERKVGLPFAAPLRELLEYARGFECRKFGKVIFSGVGEVGLSGLSPAGVPISWDPSGNFWLADVKPDGDWGPIWFVCHDPPVVVIQSVDLADFIGRALLGAEPVSEVIGPAVGRIWHDDPFLMPVEAARMSGDSVLSEFAEQLPEEFKVADLRNADVGAGFAWGRAGPNATLRRFGHALLFGIEWRRKSLLRRLMGR